MYLPKDLEVEKLPAILRNENLYQNYFKRYPQSPMLSDTIIKMKNDGELSEVDVDLAEFFYRVRFATPDMFEDFITDYGMDKVPQKTVRNVLEKLTWNRIVSCFTISTEENPTIPQDTKGLFKVYTLDMGGLSLVRNYRSYDDVWDFKLTNNFVSVERVSKELITTKFYLKLKGLDIRDFSKRPLVYVGDKNINPDFKLIIKNKDSTPYFLGQVILKDFNEETTRELLLGYESVEKTKFWMKYSKQQPITLFICEDEETLKRFSDLTDRVFMERMRFTTFERLKAPLWEQGTFQKREKGVLMDVVSSHFAPVK